MQILCVTHEDFETPGVIEDWAKLRGHNFEIVRPYKGEQIKPGCEFDLLLLMGGPQSAIKLNEDPYLVDEIALIKSAIAKDKKLLGFCLGAQLIGEALGARTERSPEKEVGVFTLVLTEDALSDPLLVGLSPELPAIHWHNDMPGLTPEAKILAYTPGCPRQIIRYTPKVYGFQCHLEIPLEGICVMISEDPESLAPSRYTQSAEQIKAQDYSAINNIMLTILDRIASL